MRRVSHEADYEVTEFLVVKIEVLLGLESWMCSHAIHNQRSVDMTSIRLTKLTVFFKFILESFLFEEPSDLI